VVLSPASALTPAKLPPATGAQKPRGEPKSPPLTAVRRLVARHKSINL
jgi:hypothetical protein